MKYTWYGAGLSVYPDVCAVILRSFILDTWKRYHDGSAGIGLWFFDNVHIVEEQSKPDGNFSNGIYPIPKKGKRWDRAEKSSGTDADIPLGTDPMPTGWA